MTRLAPPEENLETSEKIRNFGQAIDDLIGSAERKRKKKKKPAAPQPEPQPAERIDSWKQILSRSKTGKAMLDEALARGIEIKTDGTIQPLGYYSPSEKIIVVNPKRTDGEIIATLAHELRHAWQDNRGFFPSPAMSPRDLVLMLHAMEADAETGGVKVSHELKQAGYPDALNGHLGTGYGDISAKYVEMVEKNPASADDGTATRAAYDQWFEKSWRRNGYAQQAISIIVNNIKIFATVLLTTGFTALTGDYLEGMGAQPDGSNYLKATKDKGEPIVGDHYRKGLAPQLEEMLVAIDDALASLLKPRKPDADPKDNPKDPADPEIPGAPTAPTDPALNRLIRRFTPRDGTPRTPCSTGLFIPPPATADRYREQRRGYQPTLTP